MNNHDKANKGVLCQLKVVVREKRKEKRKNGEMLARKSKRITFNDEKEIAIYRDFGTKVSKKIDKNRQIGRFYRDKAHN
jgi:hypothetical protein